MHIPGLAQNFLLVSRLNDVGIQFSFSNGVCRMNRDSMVLAKGTRMETLYKLDACAVQCNSASTKSSKSDHVEKGGAIPKGANSLEMKLPAEKTMLCHQRLRNIGEKGLKALKNKILVEGLDDCNIEFDFCKHSIYGKKHYFSFYSSPHKSSGILDYIHADVFGLVNVPFFI